MAKMQARRIVGNRVHNPSRVAPVGDLRSKPVGNPEASLRQSQQHRAAVGTDAATIEGGGDLLETVSRGLGVTAATLSGWRDAFLAADEAALTKSATGEELESDRRGPSSARR